ncbi:MAG: DUF2258 domain-containing protein [Desulfurococcaceae archaeon]
MPRLNTGLIYAAIYADKIRKTVFAQLKEFARDKEVAKKINYYVARLNRALFTLLIEDIKLSKDDGIKIMIDYEFDEVNKSITWKWDTLQIVVYKKMPEDQIKVYLEKFIPIAEELSTGIVSYSIEKIGETIDGDLIYAIKIGDKEIGAVSIYVLNGNKAVLKKASILEPTPVHFEKTVIDYAGKSLEDALKEELGKVIQKGIHTSYDEAIRIINALREKVKLEPLSKVEESE